MHVSNHGFLVTEASLPETAEEVVVLFERIAAQEGWQPEGELRAHVNRSTYFGLRVASNEKGVALPRSDSRLAAGLQLVAPDAAGGLPPHRVWPELAPADPKHSAHIAMLAVAPEWRGKEGGLFWILTAAMWNHCVRSGIRDLYLEATPRTMRCYQRLGWPLQVQGELREHWGELCYPCSLSVREVAGALAERAVYSHSYQKILAEMVSMKK